MVKKASKEALLVSPVFFVVCLHIYGFQKTLKTLEIKYARTGWPGKWLTTFTEMIFGFLIAAWGLGLDTA